MEILLHFTTYFFFHCGTKFIPDNAQGFVIFYFWSFDVSLKTKEPSVLGLVALEMPFSILLFLYLVIENRSSKTDAFYACHIDNPDHYHDQGPDHDHGHDLDHDHDHGLTMTITMTMTMA